MSFPKYPKYKDSGVEWLGMVPEHWNVTRSDGQIRTSRDSIDAEKLSGREVYHYSIPVVQETGQGQVEDGDEIDSAKLVVSEPQILVSKLNPRKGTVCIATPKDRLTVCSTEFVPVIPVGTDLGFLAYLVQTENYRCRLESLVESVTRSHQRVQPVDVVRFLWAFPSRSEQSSISSFLDHETSKIDALISEQEKLIELLKEKRASVISHAVTKGLNENVKMKDSGVEWLGMVPEHWEIKRIKAVSSFSGGGTPSRENLGYWNGDIPWVSPKDMKMERIVGAEESITEEGLSSSAASMVPSGAVLMVVRSGILKHTIPVAINEVPVALNQDMKALRLDSKRCAADFFLRFVQGLNDRLLLVWSKQGATVESIEHDYLAKTIIPLPPLSEQQAITSFLDREIGKLNSLIEESEAAINLLQERRSALISAAVTGQIDVHDFVPSKAA